MTFHTYREHDQCDRLVGLEQWTQHDDGKTRMRCCPGEHTRWEVMHMRPGAVK